MTRHMPGNPQFTVRHRPGAASLNLVNELYNVLPKDGSVIGMFARSIALNRLLGREGTKFDPVSSTGSAPPTTRCRSAASGTASACNDREFLARPLVFAANAPGAESEVYPNILNNLVGTKFKVVAGYPGVNDLLLALERGEADARCGWSWGAVKAARPEWLRDKKIYIAVQFATAKHPELPDVPLATDLARTTASARARPDPDPAGHGPAVRGPARRTGGAGRRAAPRFRAGHRDPAFLAEADKLQLEIKLVDGETLQAMVERMFKAPPEVVAAARAAIGRSTPRYLPAARASAIVRQE